MNTEITVLDKMADEKCEMYSSNICSPITSIEELNQCIKTPPTWTDAILKLKGRSDSVIKNRTTDCHREDYNFLPNERLSKNLAPKTLICHDMKNGYLEDKYVGRVNIGNGYTFYRWAQIDIFVYFSHHLITIPPLSWINLAHKNGVPILGTFITEWDDGKLTCNEIFKDVETLQSTADALIQICSIFKLDGWLLNIENKIDNPQNLKRFVQYLTDNLHRNRKDSYVIWYDSVTNTGELKWQNELNERNRCYFDLCDGIFLNYTWEEKNLEKTVRQAQHRIQDVYVGLDVFGRGCFGGGKFKSYIAAEVVRKYNLSLAIFAQGWTHETLTKEPEDTFLERFHLRDNAWWNILWPYLYTHPIKYCFETMFEIGANTDFYDLQSQARQLSNFLSSDKISEMENLKLLEDRCSCLKDSMVGNNLKICRISNLLLPENATYVHRLFSTEIFLTGSYVVYCYTKSVQATDYNIILLMQNKYRHITKVICHSNGLSRDYQGNITERVPLVDNSFLRKDDIPSDWDLRAFEIVFYEDVLLEIGFSIVGRSSIDLCGFGITVRQ